MTDELYKRQKELDLNPPKKVTVIGVGGVGSWVALDLALAGVEKLYLADHDEIERHNLNRTPFKESQIGQDKTQAVAELVAERRMDAEVIPINKRIEDTGGAFRDDIEESVVIDCRDHASPLPDGIMENVLLTAGYDGYQYTMHLNPDYDNIWGDEETEYETVPSFIAPPQFVASLITVVTSDDTLRNKQEESIESGDMRRLLDSMLFGEKDEVVA